MTKNLSFDKRYIVLIIIMIYPLISAQVPFEYFELSSLEPPQSLSGGEFNEPPQMPKLLYLDSQTQRAGDLTLSEPFAPPVGNHIRRRVYSKIELNDAQQVFIVPDSTSCQPWVKEDIPAGYNLHRSALVYRESDGTANMDIPGDSPEMLIHSFRSYDEEGVPIDDVTLLKCSDGIYSASAARPGKYRFEYETVSLPGASEPKTAEFFMGKTCTPAQKESPEVQAFLDELVMNNPELEKMSRGKDIIYHLVQHFQAFTSESLTEADSKKGVFRELVHQMLREKKGLCRHRAFLMVLAARAVGCSSRIVANEIHAFVEIETEGRWYPVELGGDARSLTIQPTSPHLSAKTLTNYSFWEEETPSDSSSEGQKKTSSLETTRSSRGVLEDGEPVGTQVSRERLSVVPVKFIPEKKPAVLTRDVAFEISGTFVDENGNPFEEREVQLELKHERRSMKQRVMLDSQGRGRVTVRLPADWPLGPTEAIWRVFEAE